MNCAGRAISNRSGDGRRYRQRLGAKDAKKQRRSPLTAAIRCGRRCPNLSLFALLVIVNLGVFLYHGDPRQLFDQAMSQQAARAGTKVAVATSTANATTTEPQTPNVSPGLRELAGPPAVAPDTEIGVKSEVSVVASEAFVGPPLVMSMADEPVATPSVYSPVFSPDFSSDYSVRVARLRNRQTAAGALQATGLESREVAAALTALSGLIDFRRLRPGQEFVAWTGKINEVDGQVDVPADTSADALLALEFAPSPLQRFRAELGAEGWHAEEIPVASRREVLAVVGEIQSSLWNALVGAGERAALVSAFVEIFAWEVDFYSEVFPGDRFRILVEKDYVDDEFVGYGRIVAAEFESPGEERVHRGFLSRRDGSTAAYFDEGGGSMRKQLLKSPLQYGHVTSRFGSRKHPILGYRRNHNGIDYGVPTGTPVWSTGDGRVARAGWHRGFGKLVEIRHANGWLSQYAHLSKILVRTGQRVSQKQYIGKVGSTGMSTGPHLHYGLKRHGSYVNPLAQRFARAKSLTGPARDRFKREIAPLRLALDQLGRGTTPNLPAVAYSNVEGAASVTTAQVSVTPSRASQE